MGKRVVRGDRPDLVVESRGGKQLGNCYYASYHRVTSLDPLSGEKLVLLRKAGFLGYGQEFRYEYVNSGGGRSPVPDKIDYTYKVEPTGHDVVPSVEVDEFTDEVIRSPSINPYSGKEDPPSKVPYYVYECESRVDSSD